MYFLANVSLVSLLVYFGNVLRCNLVNYIIKENDMSLQNLEKCMACCTPEDLRWDFLFKYPIEIFLSIM